MRGSLREPGPAIKRHLRRALGPVGSVVAVRTPTPTAVLTFDDGPEPGGSDRVLSALAEHGVRATFFVLLSRVRRYPGLLADMVAAGHEIALHGLDHRRLTAFSAADVRRQCVAGRRELEDRIARPVRWFRPPYGAQTPSTSLAIRRAGLTPVLWGASSWDWKAIAHDARLARVRETVADGSILLCHDGFADSRDGVDNGPVPEVDRGRLTSAIIEICRERGLRASNLSDALQHGAAVREAHFRR